MTRTVTPAELKAMQAKAMPEKELQQLVIDCAQTHGWMAHHHYDSRRSEPGWPDLVLVEPVQRIVIFAELKSQKGRVRPEQREWLNALERTFRKATTPRTRDRLMVAIWRPSDWLDGTIEAILRGDES